MIHKENGNVFIFILLAIVLLGLLSVVLMRSSTDTNETGDFEREQIVASEILNYAKSIEVGVQNLLYRGCSENDISFWHDSNGDGTATAADDYFNANSPTDFSCHIFRPQGAGLTYTPPNDSWLDNSFDTATDFGNIIFTGSLHKASTLDVAGNTLNKKDIIVIFPYLREGICRRVNVLSRAAIGTANPPQEDDTSAAEMKVKYTGGYSLGADIDANGSDPGSTVFADADGGCTRPDDVNSFMVFYVVHNRD